MSASELLLLGLNVALVAKLFTPLAPLLAFTLGGYLVVLHAALVRDRLEGAAARVVPVGALVLWTAAWALLKAAPLELDILGRLPSLGLTGLTTDLPRIAGSSYIFLKVYDVIRRVQRGEPAPGLVRFLNQMLFAPSFLAGPIVGPEPFGGGFAPTRASAAEGANRILGGLLKLCVIAELLGQLNFLAAPNAHELAALLPRGQAWLGLYASSLWIYFNFAGYSDLAVGFGLLAGVRLPENFDAPYLAGNPSDFWQRWHMSFTSWLREHVFGPVSKALLATGLRGGAVALAIPTAATMIACGLWHRASAPFLVWGAYHAFVVVAHQLFASRLKPRLAAAGLATFFSGRAYRALATVVTFHAMSLGWVFFLPLDAPLAAHIAVLRRLVLP